MISLRLDEKTQQRLSTLAEMTGRTKTFYVKEALTKHLEDMEDIYLCEQVLNDIKSNEEELITHDDFWQQLAD